MARDIDGKPIAAGGNINPIVDVASRRKIASESDSDDDISSSMYPESESRIINLFDHNGILRFSIKESDLYYIISQDNYVRIHSLNNGEMTSYMLRCPLKVIEKSIKGSSLIRCTALYSQHIQNQSTP